LPASCSLTHGRALPGRVGKRLLRLLEPTPQNSSTDTPDLEFTAHRLTCYIRRCRIVKPPRCLPCLSDRPLGARRQVKISQERKASAAGRESACLSRAMPAAAALPIVGGCEVTPKQTLADFRFWPLAVYCKLRAASPHFRLSRRGHIFYRCRGSNGLDSVFWNAAPTKPRSPSRILGGLAPNARAVSVPRNLRAHSTRW
jgi:hypothetical protein